jgi:hypothetical protein
VLVELDSFPERTFFIHESEHGRLLYAVLFPDGLDDCLRVNALVDVKGNSRDFKRGPLGLTGPIQIRLLPLLQFGQRGFGAFGSLSRQAVVDDLLDLAPL